MSLKVNAFPLQAPNVTLGGYCVEDHGATSSSSVSGLRQARKKKGKVEEKVRFVKAWSWRKSNTAIPGMWVRWWSEVHL